MRAATLAMCLVLAACSQGAEETKPAATETSAPVAVQPSAKTETPKVNSTAPLIAGRFAPRDECGNLPGWKPFAAAIGAAVAGRDAKAFAALASADILLDFGGGAGRSELVKRLNDRKASDLWDDLERVLTLGCAKADTGTGASMPWFWEQDLGGADPFEVWLVTGDAVPLLSAADPKAKPQARLGWVLVGPVGDYNWEAQFRQIRVVGRKEQGYVETKYLRSQIDYRLISERIDGTWRITHLIAGD